MEQRATGFFGQALAHGFAAGMGVNIDQAGHHHEPAAVDFHIDIARVARPRVASPHIDDGISGENNVGMAQEYVAFRLVVPGDDPICRFNSCGLVHYSAVTSRGLV
ncbi:MAG: hypothetical protein VCD50_12175 [Alphaproteobacteria bacterium]